MKSSASSHAVHSIVPTHNRESPRESQSDNIGFGSVARLLKDYGSTSNEQSEMNRCKAIRSDVPGVTPHDVMASDS